MLKFVVFQLKTLKSISNVNLNFHSVNGTLVTQKSRIIQFRLLVSDKIWIVISPNDIKPSNQGQYFSQFFFPGKKTEKFSV